MGLFDSVYIPCPRNCHERCLYHTAGGGCPRILYEDRIVVLENALAEAETEREELRIMRDNDILSRDRTIEDLRRRIRELDVADATAELVRQRDEARAALAECKRRGKQLMQHWHREEKNANRTDLALQQAEAVLAAEREKRCVSCEWLKERLGKYECLNVTELRESPDPDEFACNRYSARQAPEVEP